VGVAGNVLILETVHSRSTLGRRAFSVAQCRQFPEDAKDTSVSECTWTLSALEALRNALYKFKTYLQCLRSIVPVSGICLHVCLSVCKF